VRRFWYVPLSGMIEPIAGVIGAAVVIAGCLTMLGTACRPADASVAPSLSPTITQWSTAMFIVSTPTPTSTARLSPAPMASFTPPANGRPLTLTIVYDNRTSDARLKTAWGFACLIETGAATILAELKRLGVQQVAPSHCTGEGAIEQFRTEFGAGFIPAGAGAVINMAQ
jgi:hypothetical protein